MTKEELNKLAEQIANVKNSSMKMRMVTKCMPPGLDRGLIEQQIDKLDETYIELCRVFHKLHKEAFDDVPF